MCAAEAVLLLQDLVNLRQMLLFLTGFHTFSLCNGFFSLSQHKQKLCLL